MIKTVTGSFEVKSSPREADDTLRTLGAMAMRFDKTFSGPLNATSIVAMMGLMNPATKSGAYVALEKISGTLDGKSGSFCMYHSSSMDNGNPHQLVSVVPGSGTDALTGLKGNLKIDITDGKHFYTFAYELAE